MTYTTIGISEDLKLKLNMLKLISGKKTMEELLGDMYKKYVEEEKEINPNENTF